MFLKFLPLTLVAGGFIFASCSNEPQGLDSLDPVCFETQIQPLIENSCAVSGCHNASTHEAGFDFSTYEGIVKAVKAGNARQSKLYQVLSKSYGEIMPPNSPLSLDSRNLIKVWIEQGAKETTCTTSGGGGSTSSDTVCFNLDILPLIASNCAKSGCHDATTAEEGLVLTSYANIGGNSNLVKPGNYANSKLYRVLIASGEDKMPPSPNTALTTAQINKIKTWITDGALNSQCVVQQCDTAGTISYANQVWPIIQNNCLGCHPASGSTNGISLGNYTQVHSVASTIRNSTSLLSGALNHLSGFKAMPPSTTLDDCKIATIDKWITQGIANN